MAARDTRGVGRGRSGRDRVIDAAYWLFSRAGVRVIGVDTISAEADVAKMTLYRNFASENELALAFLALREALLEFDDRAEPVPEMALLLLAREGVAPPGRIGKT